MTGSRSRKDLAVSHSQSAGSLNWHRCALGPCFWESKHWQFVLNMPWKHAEGIARSNLPALSLAATVQNMRVVQRNLVYVVGLALDLCHEDTLKGADYFGQFGRIVKVCQLFTAACAAPRCSLLVSEACLAQISVSRAGPYGTATNTKNGPSGSAYVTYRLSDDARKCIAAVHGAAWEGARAVATDATAACSLRQSAKACSALQGSRSRPATGPPSTAMPT